MPRRYASYSLDVGPVLYFTDLHQLAALGAFVLAIGQIIFVWNIVTSWLEGTEAGIDPWGLEDRGQRTNEWEWFEQDQDQPTVADGAGDVPPESK